MPENELQLVDANSTQLNIVQFEPTIKVSLDTKDGKTTFFYPTREQLAKLIGALAVMLATPEKK